LTQEAEAGRADPRHERHSRARPEGGAGRADHESSSTWDLKDGTRAFAKRFAERHPQKNYPNDMQAGVYASVLHYLKAVDKVGGAADGKAVVAAMKTMPTDDPLFGKGIIRSDGRKIHPFYLLEVKKPEESDVEMGSAEGRRNDPGRPGVSSRERRQLARWSRNKLTDGGRREPAAAQNRLRDLSSMLPRQLI
jgi:hypothetical protein